MSDAGRSRARLRGEGVSLGVALRLRACGRLLADRGGQATLEYLLVGIVLLAIVLAFGALCGRLADGTFSRHITDSASHSVSSDAVDSAGDIVFF